ncbi:MAG: hypothetical protein QXG00_04340 [Candidatus Woesearchaeota archaeon]
MKTKAQTWTTDFIIGLLLFSFALVFSFKFVSNNLVSSDFDEIYQDGKFISDNLMSEGVPNNWSNDKVFRIGLLSNNKLNTTKVLNMTKLDYGNVKTLLNTRYDFYIYFADKYNNVLNISGFCGFGSSKVKIDYEKNIAYYSGNSNDEILKNILENEYDAQVFAQNFLQNLLSSIDQYYLIVMENPNLDLNTPSYSTSQIKDIIENWISEGRLLYLSQDLDIGEEKFLGVNFSNSISPDNTFTVVNTEPTLNLSIDQIIDTVNDKGIIPIDTNLYFIQVAKDSVDNTGIGVWNYGLGKIYYFSDFVYQNPGGNFSNEINTSIANYAEKTCGKINIQEVKAKDLVKIERFVVYKQKIVRMIIYLWSK